MDSEPYPDGQAARNRWVLSRRGPKNRLNPWQPYAALWEEETGPDGQPMPTATVFLTNRECPYRCLFCDLWQNTLDAPTPASAIPTQIAAALQRLPPARQIKLYNAGSFFDPQAIPPEDYPEIARLVAPFEKVVVESHPALIGSRCLSLKALIPGQLEVAIGLETAHPQVLEKLNKRITLASFRKAADFLAENGIALRVFLLVRPPFMTEAEGVEWAMRSLDVAFDAGASVCCLIPTRGGNGAMETLREQGLYAPPSLTSLEATQEYGLRLQRGRVFTDTWDIETFYACACSPRRAERLHTKNRTQTLPPPVVCGLCS